MGIGHSPGTKHFEELAFFYDSSNPRSYSGIGSTWTDLSGSGIHSSISNMIYSGIGRTAATFVFNAFTAADVAQNYHSHKGRYGLS